MKRLLHIIATPRTDESRTLKVSSGFLSALKDRYPGIDITSLNLYEEILPELTVRRVSGKYTLLSGGELEGEERASWSDILKYIEQFLSYEAYLVSTPMWNFSTPYVLKHYIDLIFQPRYLFRYTEKGPEGLVKGRKMIVITSRGGDYSEGGPAHSFDLLEPYLRTVFGLAGIDDITFINAQPMDALGPGVRDERLKSAIEEARSVARGL